MQLIERRLARRQRFCVAHELEARIDGIANDIGEVIQIQRRNVLGAILQSQRAERPVERIAVAAFAVDIVIERREARPSGKKRREAMRWARLGSRPCRNRMTGAMVAR